MSRAQQPQWRHIRDLPMFAAVEGTGQASIDPSRLDFTDESWAKTNMAPLRGQGPEGQRLNGSVPFGR